MPCVKERCVANHVCLIGILEPYTTTIYRRCMEIFWWWVCIPIRKLRSIKVHP